ARASPGRASRFRGELEAPVRTGPDFLMQALARQDPRDIALVDARTGQAICFGDLVGRIEAAATRLASPSRGLALVCADQSIEGVILLLAAWHAGHAVFPHRPRSPQALATARQAYRPCWTIAPAELLCDASEAAPLTGDYLVLRDPDPTPVDARLALLLSTSGSMSAPRTVRISWPNLEASLTQIAERLAPRAGERMLLALPIGHVYGLTSLLSHLVAGATTVLQRASVLDPRFGAAFVEHRIGVLPAVSFMLDTLRTTAWRDGAPASLRKVTHSGDRLSEASLNWALDLRQRTGAAFYRMYGMTETTGRISVLAPDDLAERPGSVGQLVSGGEVRLDDGEIIFTGPNAAHGYAASARDLVALSPAEEVRTGDLGHRDGQGFLYLTGRRSRVAKLLGVRVSLDELETAFLPAGEVAAIARDDAVVVFAAADSEVAVTRRLHEVAMAFAIPRTKLLLRLVDDIPRTPTGKVLYARLPG
ncbi:MAG TPA: AMP-binding protein, partial [Caulobacter sp.]|nr:AMP-binding protein [Caulobacter sp.]